MAISSMAIHSSTQPRPLPPYSAGKRRPRSPRPAASTSISFGNCIFSASMSSRYCRSIERVKSRISSCRASCASVMRKSNILKNLPGTGAIQSARVEPGPPRWRGGLQPAPFYYRIVGCKIRAYTGRGEVQRAAHRSGSRGAGGPGLRGWPRRRKRKRRRARPGPLTRRARRRHHRQREDPTATTSAAGRRGKAPGGGGAATSKGRRPGRQARGAVQPDKARHAGDEGLPGPSRDTDSRGAGPVPALGRGRGQGFQSEPQEIQLGDQEVGGEVHHREAAQETRKR